MKYKMDEIINEANINKRLPKNCEKASEYMMKYMDGTMNGAEIEWLRSHVDECASCRGDFIIYDTMIEEFSKTELVNAPDCFEESVMARIALIKDESAIENAFSGVKRKADQSIDNILCCVWGIFSIIFGSVFLIFLNREQIMDTLAESTMFAGYIQVIRPFAQVVTDFIGNIGMTASSIFAVISGFISAYSYAFVAILAILVIAQYILKIRTKGFDVAFANENNDIQK